MRQNNLILFTISLICIRLTGLNAQAVKDVDGNVYPAITIGKQVWMAENLKTTKYNDGAAILLVKDDKAWKALKKPAYCWYNNNIANKDVYGALYNWYTVSTKKLCPKGWHVPTDAEWTTLTNFIGDPISAGDKLKESGQDHWKNTLNSGTNEFDFTALPGGMRLESGGFPIFGNSYAVWWSSTEYDPKNAKNRGLYFSTSNVYSSHDDKRNGFSIRCLKDN
jgi:uncharacterized protein (TIGR02145 family)